MKTDDDYVIKAEIFKLIRANGDKTAKQVMEIISQHFTDIEKDRVQMILIKLLRDIDA